MEMTQTWNREFNRLIRKAAIHDGLSPIENTRLRTVVRQLRLNECESVDEVIERHTRQAADEVAIEAARNTYA